MNLISQEPAGEKGILEQSQITLVSVTDTTAEDLETTVTEEATWDPDAVEETEVTNTNSGSNTARINFVNKYIYINKSFPLS